MEAFRSLDAVAAPLLLDNIDTDAIIPSEPIKRAGADREKLAAGLFFERRFDADGKERPDFVLNQGPFRDAEILIAGANFGCGSSREHAVWALLGFGIRCVVAESFGDIFEANAFRNGMLLIQLAPEVVRELARRVSGGGKTRIQIDLEAQRLVDGSGEAWPFSIDPVRKRALMLGLDAIAQTLEHEVAIADFERRARRERPWVYNTRFATGRGSSG